MEKQIKFIGQFNTEPTIPKIDRFLRFEFINIQ